MKIENIKLAMVEAYGIAIGNRNKVAVLRGLPWISRRKAYTLIIHALDTHHTALLERLKKEEKTPLYAVTVGYEKFPYYYDIKQKGDWYFFCDGFKVVTIRHKDETFDHTIYYKHEVIKAKNEEKAKEILERNSKYHICSFDFEEVAKDD